MSRYEETHGESSAHYHPITTPAPVCASSAHYVVACSTRSLQGHDLLKNKVYTKGSAFTHAERKFLNLEGLLPPAVSTQETQMLRIKNNLQAASTDLHRYEILMALGSRNQKLFYYYLQHNVIDALPIVYTPTVGLACQKFGSLYNTSRGMYISIEHKGRVQQVLRNWPARSVKAIVFTDGERILGLGDLGASGMGIPLGKLSLYTALGGIDPTTTLPVTIDVGTNNETFRNDPLYTGLKIPRTRGQEYDDLIEEFIQAARAEFGANVLLQFEDFGNVNAFRLLRKYEDRCCTFNDDIQGTASVVTAGVLAAVPLTGVGWKDHRFLFYGAGSAGLGIAQLIAGACSKATGCSMAEARAKIWCIDSRGLVFRGRASGGINQDKEPFAHEWEHAATLGASPQPLEVYLDKLGITGMFGVSAMPSVFTEAAIKQLSKNTARPIIFALSNPTSKAECTAADAYTHSEGRALFASGSPFPAFTDHTGKVHVPGQGNNSYIFPGVALATLCVGATRIPNSVFLTAAESLASQVKLENIAQGTLYPSLSTIREVSAVVAAAVAADLYSLGVATVLPQPADLLAFCKDSMWDCNYENFCPPGYQ